MPWPRQRSNSVKRPFFRILVRLRAGDALDPSFVRQVKAGGYKAVHMVPKGQLTTVPRYDEMITHQSTLSPNNTRPESSVVRTIGQ